MEKLCECLAISKPMNGQSVMFAVGYDVGYIWLYDDASQNIFHEFKAHENIVYCIAFSLHDGGKMLASGSFSELSLWDTTTRLCLHKFSQEVISTVSVRSVSFSPSGNLLVSGDEVGFITLWDMPKKTRAEKWREYISRVLCTAVSSDNRLIALAQESGDFMMYDIRNLAIDYRKVDTIDVLLSGAAFSQDCRLLATVESKKPLKLWNTDGNHMLLMQFDFPGVHLTTVRFSPDDKQLITASSTDAQIFIWNVDNPSPVRRLSLKHSKFFDVLFDSCIHPNGKQILSISRNSGLHIQATCEWDDRINHRFFSIDFRKRVFLLMCIKMHQETHHGAVRLPMQLWLNIFEHLAVLCG